MVAKASACQKQQNKSKILKKDIRPHIRTYTWKMCTGIFYTRTNKKNIHGFGEQKNNLDVKLQGAFSKTKAVTSGKELNKSFSFRNLIYRKHLIAKKILSDALEIHHNDDDQLIQSNLCLQNSANLQGKSSESTTQCRFLYNNDNRANMDCNSFCVRASTRRGFDYIEHWYCQPRQRRAFVAVQHLQKLWPQ